MVFVLAFAALAYAQIPPPPPSQGGPNASTADNRSGWRLTKLTGADPLPDLGAPADYTQALREGSSLDSNSAQALERSLQGASEQLDAHLRLLAYYGSQTDRVNSSDIGRSDFQHQLWLVENSPRSAVFRRRPQLFNCNVHGANDPQVSQMVTAWRQQVTRHPGDAEILENAAAVLQLLDNADTADYLKQLRRMEPTFTHIAIALALVYTQAITRMTDPHGPLPADGFGPIALAELQRSNDVAVVGFSGAMLYMLGRVNGDSKPYAATGEALLTRAASLDGTNPDWPQMLKREPLPSIGAVVVSLMSSARERDLWAGGAAPEMAVPSAALRVSADNEAKKLVKSVVLDYNPAASGLSHGTVVLHALISREGKVERLEVADGPLPVLPSVIDAVRNWTYSPTVIEGHTVEVSTDIALEFSVPNTPAGTGAAGGVIGGMIGKEPLVPFVAPPPPPPPLTASPAPSEVRVAGAVAEANLIEKVQPVYPPVAKAARIQGTVAFTATISKEGVIVDLQLVRGHPLLVNAARDAAVQWRYKPTLLNGKPVTVITNISINFVLSQ